MRGPHQREMKECNHCRIEKLESDFGIRSDTGKPHGGCRECYNRRVKAKKSLEPSEVRAKRLRKSREYMKERRRANPGREAAAQRARRLRHPEQKEERSLRRKHYRWAACAEKLQLVRDLKSHPCQDCGGRFAPVAMDWDHRDPKTKWHNVSFLAGGPEFTKADVVAEIAKCDLVCANCHRVRTFRHRLEKDARICAGFGAPDFSI
jgi:hypothetical protein